VSLTKELDRVAPASDHDVSEQADDISGRGHPQQDLDSGESEPHAAATPDIVHDDVQVPGFHLHVPLTVISSTPVSGIVVVVVVASNRQTQRSAFSAIAELLLRCLQCTSRSSVIR